jgi:hypothetical protein
MIYSGVSEIMVILNENKTLTKEIQNGEGRRDDDKPRNNNRNVRP